MTTALIDGDIVLYPICAAHERETSWGDIHTLHSEWSWVQDNVMLEIAKIKESVGASKAIIAFSDSENFRKSLSPTYKAKRQKRKPLCFGRMVEHYMDFGEGVRYPGLEADDVLGILATGAMRVGSVIVSSDKDLKTVPGDHYDPSHPERGVFKITPKEAYWWHMVQTLSGDTTDGYSGCPGVGDVGAPKVLEEAVGSLWEAVVREYGWAAYKASRDKPHRKAEFSELWSGPNNLRQGAEQDALLQARLAFILQADYWDYETSEVKLWEPKSATVLSA